MSTANTYIATDTAQTAIYGLGDTEAAAIADARRQIGPGTDLADLVAYPASNELIAEVEDMGGNICWDTVDGVAVLPA